MTKLNKSLGSFSLFSFFLVVLGLLSGCASGPTTEGGKFATAEGPKTRQIETEARPLYFQAEKSFTNKNYDEAQRLFQIVRTRFPRGKAQLYASYRLGIIHYYREDYARAAKEFEYFTTRFPQSELSFDAIYNLAACEYQLGHYQKSNEALAKLKVAEIQAQGPRRAETVYQLAARTAAALNNFPGVVAASAMQLQLPLEDATRASIDQQVVDSLGKVTRKTDLDQLLTEVTEPGTKARINERMIALAAVEAPPVLPAPTAEGVSATTVEGPVGGSSGDRLSIGVILPLTGKKANYGKRALEGVLLAAKIFQTSDIDFRIFVKDSGSNPLVAQNAVDDLFYRRNVMAIIGPLYWKESLAVADRAQQLGVLNLSLSPKEGISERGNYLFQNALTPRVQLESLVNYCIGNRNLKRFAILSPDNDFGTDAAMQFWDLVEKYGGKVVGFLSYKNEEKDFQSYIQDLVGLSSPKYRRVEYARLNDYVQQIKAKTNKEPKLRLPPVVDFDALFIPDNPKTVAQIAPSLAYFDVLGMPLLGTTEWNNDQFYKRGGKYIESAIFPAGLNLNTHNARQREFIRQYQEAYGTYPDFLSTQAFEAMALIATGIRDSGSRRSDLVNSFLKMKDFEAPLGNLTFDTFRIARRRLPVLTVEPGGNTVEH